MRCWPWCCRKAEGALYGKNFETGATRFEIDIISGKEKAKSSVLKNDQLSLFAKLSSSLPNSSMIHTYDYMYYKYIFYKYIKHIKIYFNEAISKCFLKEDKRKCRNPWDDMANDHAQIRELWKIWGDFIMFCIFKWIPDIFSCQYYNFYLSMWMQICFAKNKNKNFRKLTQILRNG